MVSRPSPGQSRGPSRVVNMLEAKTHLSRLDGGDRNRR
jgi:hypothetical protein